MLSRRGLLGGVAASTALAATRLLAGRRDRQLQLPAVSGVSGGSSEPAGWTMLVYGFGLSLARCHVRRKE
jgi:hypothetical protein